MGMEEQLSNRFVLESFGQSLSKADAHAGARARIKRIRVDENLPGLLFAKKLV